MSNFHPSSPWPPASLYWSPPYCFFGGQTTTTRTRKNAKWIPSGAVIKREDLEAHIQMKFPCGSFSIQKKKGTLIRKCQACTFKLQYVPDAAHLEYTEMKDANFPGEHNNHHALEVANRDGGRRRQFFVHRHRHPTVEEQSSIAGETASTSKEQYKEVATNQEKLIAEESLGATFNPTPPLRRSKQTPFQNLLTWSGLLRKLQANDPDVVVLKVKHSIYIQIYIYIYIYIQIYIYYILYII